MLGCSWAGCRTTRVDEETLGKSEGAPRMHGKGEGAGHEFERVGCMLGCSRVGWRITRLEKEALWKSEGAGHEFERVLNILD